MLYKLKTILFCIILLLNIKTAAQESADYKINEIVVTASRTPAQFSSLSRSVVLITPREIEYSAVNSIQDLLRYVPGADVRSRGVEGVQSDIGIRGGGFEQTLVLINGIKLSDPQTAHHNLNLPVPLNAVERIEVLKGQGSRVFGANAFSGAVNIITKSPKNFSFAAQITGGENGMFGASFFNSHSIGNLNNIISYSKDKSDGYRENTAFDNTTFFYNSAYSFARVNLNLQVGYNDKKFGAYNFYSDKYPNQWEHTTTKFSAFTAAFDLGKIDLTQKLFWRGNDDDYILDNTRPDWYRNIHKTNSFGTEIQADISSVLGITSIGGELSIDKIKSTNLGDHDRTKGGFFAEQLFSPVKKLNISAGFFLYNYSSVGWKLWPGLDASYMITDNTKIFFSAGKAFRIPSFTELYYKSPANMGNPDLLNEETTNYEAGISYSGESVILTGNVFYKEGKNIIDWVRATSNDIWTVRNETSLNTGGIETGIILFPKSIIKNIPIVVLSINYTYLSMDRNTTQFQSKYSLDHLKHQIIISVDNDLVWGIKQKWMMRYESRENFEDHFIVDSKVIKEFKMFTFFLRASNLFNKSYMDIASIPLPGRWISAGIQFLWN